MEFNELGAAAKPAQLPRLNRDVGRIVAQHMSRAEQFEFDRALQMFAAKDSPNLASIKSLGINKDKNGNFMHLTLNDIVESEDLFREYRDRQNPQLERVDEKLIVTKAPIEVVRLYEETRGNILDSVLYRNIRYDILLTHGEDISTVRAKIPTELSAVAIDSIYRSLPNNLADTFAQYIAEATRLDAMKYITAMGRRPLAITVSDIGVSPASIPTMAWARKNGKEWREMSTMHDDMYRSLDIVKWIDKNGYPWGFVDWWGVFAPNTQPNTDVIEYLIDKIPISDTVPDDIDPTYHEWRDRQQTRWRNQLLSLETLQEAPIHEYPDDILYKAPPEVLRAYFERLGQEGPLGEYIVHSRYDMFDADLIAQIPEQFEINVRTTEHMADTTLIGIYRATEGKNRYPLVCTLMREGRLNVLRNIVIPYQVKIFDADFTDPTNLNIPQSVIRWALAMGYEWGTLHHPADPLLMKLYKSLGAPV